LVVDDWLSPGFNSQTALMRGVVVGEEEKLADGWATLNVLLIMIMGKERFSSFKKPNKSQQLPLFCKCFATVVVAET
jgi:hypothetical protein